MVETKDDQFEDFKSDDRRFLAFEKKTIDEQAKEITNALLFDEEDS